jgi:hypothetical protein
MYTDKQWAKASPNVAGLIAASANFNGAYEGPPGCGKSQTVLSWSRVRQRHLILLIGSQHPPEDFSGLPYVSPDISVESTNNFFKHLPAEFLYRMTQEPCDVFLDEFTCVSPQTRAGMLNIFSERMVGGVPVHPQTIFLAAFNEPKDAPAAIPLEASVSNRFWHGKWQDDDACFDSGIVSMEDEWTPSWVPNSIPYMVQDEKTKKWEVDLDVRRRRPYWGTLIRDFRNRNTDMKTTRPTDESDYSYATQRTWHRLREALCVAENINAPLPILKILSVGMVGKQASKQFWKYRADLDLINVEDALKNPSTFKEDKQRPDLTIALVQSTVDALKKNYSAERLTQAFTLFIHVAETRADVVCTQLKSLGLTKPSGEKFTDEHKKLISSFAAKFPEKVKRSL